jgi:hypothetical protein
VPIRTFILVVLLFTSACGSSASTGDKSSASKAPAARDSKGASSSGGKAIDLSGVDACSLFDEATVHGLTGVSTRFVSQKLAGGSTCFWGSAKSGVGAYVEVSLVRQPRGLHATTFNLSPTCSVTASTAAGEEAEIANCPAGGGAPQSKVQMRAFERGVIVTLLVNDVPATEAQLAPVVKNVFSQLH